MALKPNESLIASAAVVTIVYATFQTTLPNVTDARVAPSGDSDLAAAERVATWTSAGVVAIVATLAKDPTIFVLGGLATIVLAWTHRHANAVNPMTGRAATYLPKVAADPDTSAEAYDGQAM